MAAYRDGIVGIPSCGVTADSLCAYAILACSDDELRSGDDGTFIYIPRASRTYRTKLLCNRHPVRVLRGFGGSDPLAPEVGVRYEGLYEHAHNPAKQPSSTLTLDRRYQVQKWTLTHVPNKPFGCEFFRYCFTLAPAEAETDSHRNSLPAALRHPDSLEREDWREYARERDEHVVDIADLFDSGWQGQLLWFDWEDGMFDGVDGEDDGQSEAERRDSGYAEEEARSNK